MKHILILSDTHGHLDQRLLPHIENADEIWHGGDWGGRAIVEHFEAFGKPIRGVYGNIDGSEVRQIFPLIAHFSCENIKVGITHIGGTPKNYKPDARKLLTIQTPDILLCGHSHILNVGRDAKHNNLLFINPGAAGKEGFHEVMTAIRLTIDGSRIFDLAVIEIGKRGAMASK